MHSFHLHKQVRLCGERHLHAFVTHGFGAAGAAGGGPPLQAMLTAQARHFSCFVVRVGRLDSATSFAPVGGLIVQVWVWFACTPRLPS